MSYYSEFGKNLAYYRKRARITQQNMADMLGIKQSNYNAYEKGAYAPKNARLSRISSILGCSKECLVYGPAIEIKNTIFENFIRFIRGETYLWESFQHEMEKNIVFQQINEQKYSILKSLETVVPDLINVFFSPISYAGAIKLLEAFENLSFGDNEDASDLMEAYETLVFFAAYDLLNHPLEFLAEQISAYLSISDISKDKAMVLYTQKFLTHYVWIWNETIKLLLDSEYISDSSTAEWLTEFIDY